MGRDSPASRKRRRSSSSSSSTSSSGSSSSSSNSDRKGSQRRSAGSDRKRSSDKSQRPAESGRKPSSSNHKHSSDSDERNGRALSTASFDSMDLEKMTRKKDAITSLREQKSGPGDRSSDRQGSSSQRPSTQTNHTKPPTTGRDEPFKQRGLNSPRRKRPDAATYKRRSRSPRHRSPVQRKRSPPRKQSRSPVRKEHENVQKRRSRSPAGFRNNRPEFNRGGREFQPRFNADRQRSPGFSRNRPRRSHSPAPANKRVEERKPRRSSPGRPFRRDSNETGAEKTEGFKGSINDKRWQHDGYIYSYF